MLALSAATLTEAAPGTHAAASDDHLYTAFAIVTGTDMRQRPWGFAQCFREVLVKVSGNPRLKEDSRVADTAAHPDPLIAAFDYADMMAGIPKKDDQGSYDRPHRLTVHFDPAKIDGVLAQLGEPPWRGERPVIVPALAVHGRKPPAYVLSAETTAGVEQRESFATMAAEFGMTARFPSEAELARWGVAVDHVPEHPPRAAAPNEIVVLGTLDWSETLPGWTGAWRAHWSGADHGWRITGVNYDAAFRDIVAGVVRLASGHGAPD